jgi:hypothetical protein
MNFMGAQMGEREVQRMSYLGAPDRDPLARMSYTDVSMASYGDITYGKTATMLITLENAVGEDTLRRALHAYFMKYRFQHPTQEDFLNTVNEVAQQDLGWYWQQAVYGTQMLDYEVLRADSNALNWYDKNFEAKKGVTEYETQVILHRKGDFVFPVKAEIKFDNGETIHEHWDGRDRWSRYIYHKKAKILSAHIDPDYHVTLDRDYLNNSRTTETQYGATLKIATYWTWLTQFAGQLASWLT